jgi:hypothetical protein
MVPPKVYVGDQATLVLPLTGFTGTVPDPEGEGRPIPIPPHEEIDIHRISVEKRPGGSRLILEFTAFAPGILELPPLEIGEEIISGLKIEIASILEQGESGFVLSGPAPPLAIPGTSFLVYGTISAIVLLLLTSIWVLLWGRRRINGWLLAWRRKVLLVSMLRIEKRLRKSLIKGESRRGTLDTLSSEFRTFLAYFTGANCRAMTAEELGRLSASLPADNIYFPDKGEFPGAFFNRCDKIRFNGSEISEGETLSLLDSLAGFLLDMNKSKGRKNRLLQGGESPTRGTPPEAA